MRLTNNYKWWYVVKLGSADLMQKLFPPVRQVLKRFWICYIVDKYASIHPPIESGPQRKKPLLSRCAPNDVTDQQRTTCALQKPWIQWFLERKQTCLYPIFAVLRSSHPQRRPSSRNRHLRDGQHKCDLVRSGRTPHRGNAWRHGMGTDGGLVGVCELLVHVLLHQRGLAHPKVHVHSVKGFK